MESIKQGRAAPPSSLGCLLPLIAIMVGSTLGLGVMFFWNPFFWVCLFIGVLIVFVNKRLDFHEHMFRFSTGIFGVRFGKWVSADKVKWCIIKSEKLVHKGANSFRATASNWSRSDAGSEKKTSIYIRSIGGKNNKQIYQGISSEARQVMFWLYDQNDQIVFFNGVVKKGQEIDLAKLKR